MTRAMLVIGFAAFAATQSVIAQAPARQAPASCDAIGNVQFICGQNGPEDLVVVPGSQWVVASAYGGNGGIMLIRVKDRMSSVAYPGSAPREKLDAKTYNTCPGAPDAAFKAKFLTHGLYLQEGRNSVHKLYVVVHGGREAVEVFELDAKPQTPTLTWIGCAVAPDPIGLNSVRALPDGGFIASNFLPRNRQMAALQKGEVNGELWEWHTASGWHKVPGSEASGANGLEMSPDGKTLYVAAWGSQSFFRLSRGGAKPEKQEVPLGFRVDNIRWSHDGSILAVGQGGEAPKFSTEVVKIDPKTLKVSKVISSPPVGAFNAGTVAVEIGNDYWIGSFLGDRIAIFRRGGS
jgi:hypothetical protein